MRLPGTPQARQPPLFLTFFGMCFGENVRNVEHAFSQERERMSRTYFAFCRFFRTEDRFLPTKHPAFARYGGQAANRRETNSGERKSFPPRRVIRGQTV
jgi:hypothetical protein